MNHYNTEIIQVNSPDDPGLVKAAEALRSGHLVAIPTETVYGLAANAFDHQAVEKIFEAKGRPGDNPLIVHISRKEELGPLVSSVPETAWTLAKVFWPGPLTIILPRSEKIPAAVSAGLNTVAVRLPAHPVAQAVIRKCGLPLAAPSANLSGSPSPTTAHHVYQDMVGKIPYILDGGSCTVGLESTVISLAEDIPRLLRPGGVTLEELESCIGPVQVDKAVLHDIGGDAAVSSPGMKYKHYAPKAEVYLYDGSSGGYAAYLERHPQFAALCFNEDLPMVCPAVSYGSIHSSAEQAQNLFACLRRLDETGAKKVLAHAPSKEGLGLSVYNRLLRSAAFRIITE